MGQRQENWLYGHLSDSADRGAAWRVIGSQIRFARLGQQEDDGELEFNMDSWDVSFPAAGQDLFRMLTM